MLCVAVIALLCSPLPSLAEEAEERVRDKRVAAALAPYVWSAVAPHIYRYLLATFGAAALASVGITLAERHQSKQ